MTSLRQRAVLTVIFAASCGDDGATPEGTTQATTGDSTATAAPDPTLDTTVDPPTSSTDETTATTSPVDVTTGPDDTSTSTTADTDTTDTTVTPETDTNTNAGTDTETTTTGDTEDSETDTDTDTEGVDPNDPYGGVLCGNVGTGPLGLGSLASYVAFAPPNGAPELFTGWVTETDEIRVVIYDIASATWGEPLTLQTGYHAASVADAPVGAVDGEGNAIVAYVMKAPQRLVVQRYDAAAKTWTASELGGPFVHLRVGGLTMTPGGHAVLSAYDMVGPVQVNQPSVWFYDPVGAAWSEPTTYAPVNNLFSRNSVLWDQDPATGDAALAHVPDTDKLVLQHHTAATDMLTQTVVDLSGYLNQVASIGDGEFLVMSDQSVLHQFGDIHATHFDGVDWRPTETIGNGFSVAPGRLSGGTDGRAVASWSDGQYGHYARMFDHQDGWAELQTLNPSNPMASPAWGDHRLVRDGDGFFAAYSLVFQVDETRTYARKYDGGMVEAAALLDPQNPNDFSRVYRLTSLGPDRARALWYRHNQNTAQTYTYACHAPMSGWSAPVPLTDFLLWRYEEYPGGAVLLMGMDKGGVNPRVEFFAPE